MFVARTGIGCLAFDDPMEVVRWNPPADDGVGICRLEKRGSVVTGWAEIEVRTHEAGSQVVWREDLQVVRLPRLFRRPTVWGGRLLFGRTVSGLLAEPD
ncbi:hypothetical protein ABZW18_27010 [Streptomyces sp. NPDC004647]|uniref:hypothetical protein n=1 Tax=Streptomyces sp. NPDC004647 TaxID=3154671 RepID=UPI0033AB6E45